MHKHTRFAAAVAFSIGGSLGSAAWGQTIHDDFEGEPGVNGTTSVCNLSLGSRFFANNIWGIGYTIGTDFCISKYSGIYGDSRVHPTSGFSYLVHYPLEETGDIGMYLLFTDPVTDFRFMRPRLDGTSLNNVIFPGWTLDAFDSGNNIVDTVSEASITATSTVAARMVTVSGCAIEKVKFTWNGGGTMNVPGMIIDDIVMVIKGCGSADFDGDGVDGTCADIAAFYACLGGNCCLTCGSADFDGDCDVGTEADIEAFFRVLNAEGC